MTNTFTRLFSEGSDSKTWYLARVEGTVADTSTVKVAELTDEGVGAPTTAIVATETFGDASPPKKRDVCLVIEMSSVAFIVGVIGNRSDDEPEHTQNERVINHRHSDTTLRIKDDGTVVINAHTIKLGEGGDAVARVGDSVSVSTTTGEGEITSGSDSVTSQ